MGKKKREADLEFVGRYRRAKRDHYQKALLDRLSDKLKNRPLEPTGDDPARPLRDGRPIEPQATSLVAPPWVGSRPTPQGAIPLRGGGTEPGPLRLPRRDAARREDDVHGASPNALEEPRPTANWLGLEFEEVSALSAVDVTEAAVAGSDDVQVEGGGPSSPLEQLDSVVHDFVAAIDQRAPAAPVDGVSPHAASFRRLLASSTTPTGQILGPPVLFGASPPMGLESILGMLGSMRETGVLHVEAGGATFTISIVKGDVVHGVSRPRPSSELLGNVLVSLDMVDEEQLSRFFEEHGASASTLVEALDGEALVSTEELGRALEHQLRLLFDRLLATRNAVWCFRAGEATLAYINTRLSVIGVLLESARKCDEQSAARAVSGEGAASARRAAEASSGR